MSDWVFFGLVVAWLAVLAFVPALLVKFVWLPIRRRRQKAEPVVRRVKKHRVMVVGLGYIQAGPRESVSLIVSPQRPFLLRCGEGGSCVSMPESVAAAFVVEQLVVGAESLPLSGPWPVCKIGQTITVTVRNITEQPQMFCGMLLGSPAA